MFIQSFVLVGLIRDEVLALRDEDVYQETIEEERELKDMLRDGVAHVRAKYRAWQEKK